MLWQIATESKVWEITPNQGRIVRSVDASPDGRWIATGTIDNTTRIWAADSGEAICEFDDHTGGSVFDVAFSRDGLKLSTLQRIRGSQSGMLLRSKATILDPLGRNE